MQLFLFMIDVRKVLVKHCFIRIFIVAFVFVHIFFDRLLALFGIFSVNLQNNLLLDASQQ